MMSFFAKRYNSIMALSLIGIILILTMNGDGVYNEALEIYDLEMSKFVDPTKKVLKHEKWRIDLIFELQHLQKIVDEVEAIESLKIYASRKPNLDHTCSNRMCILKEADPAQTKSAYLFFDENVEDYRGLTTQQDLDESAFYDLSLPINEEPNTGYGGKSAAKAWSKLFELTNDVSLKFHSAEDLLSGIKSSISLHISLNHCFDFDTHQFSPNIRSFTQRFSLDSPYNFTAKYFENLLDVYDLVSAAYVDRLRHMTEYELVNKFEIDFLHASKLRHMVDLFMSRISNYEEKIQLARNKLAGADRILISKAFNEMIGVIDNLAECSKCRMWGMLQIKGLAAAIRSHLDDPVSLELNRHEFQTLAKLMAKLAESLQVLLEPEPHFNTLMGEVCARKADLKSKA